MDFCLNQWSQTLIIAITLKIKDMQLYLSNHFYVFMQNEGIEEDFVNFNNHSFISDKDGKLKYQYLGPFYNEKASTGELTSTICDEVVATENDLIRKCDVFVLYHSAEEDAYI